MKPDWALIMSHTNAVHSKILEVSRVVIPVYSFVKFTALFVMLSRSP
jgi:hypothetical protein